MKRFFYLLLPVVFVIVAILYNAPTPTQIRPSTNNQTVTPTKVAQTPLPYEARFAIYTNGTKRIFTDTRYHNLSKDIYIEATNPEVIHVNKQNLTWDDFFKTLPMELTTDCILTGTKQTFCTNQASSLKFFLNGIENTNALTETIRPNDVLLVSYGPLDDPAVKTQLSEVN